MLPLPEGEAAAPASAVATAAANMPDRGAELLRADILQTLNTIIDPCSAAAAIPAGLVDMGLIRELGLERLEGSGWRCEVKLCVTHAFCMMTGIFIHEIESRLAGFAALAEVRVDLDCSTIWTEELMSQDYRSRLQEHRGRRRAE